jgi:hypothetical protein
MEFYLKVSVQTKDYRDIEEVKSSIKRGIYVDLDKKNIAQPSDVEIEFTESPRKPDITHLWGKDETLTPEDSIYNTLDSDMFWEDKNMEVKDHMDLADIIVEIEEFAMEHDLNTNTTSDWITIQNKASELMEALYHESEWNVWGDHQRKKVRDIVNEIFIIKYSANLTISEAAALTDHCYVYLLENCEPLGWGLMDIKIALSKHMRA